LTEWKKEYFSTSINDYNTEVCIIIVKVNSLEVERLIVVGVFFFGQGMSVARNGFIPYSSGILISEPPGRLHTRRGRQVMLWPQLQLLLLRTLHRELVLGMKLHTRQPPLTPQLARMQVIFFCTSHVGGMQWICSWPDVRFSVRFDFFYLCIYHTLC
jgi:hypothetical protein